MGEVLTLLLIAGFKILRRTQQLLSVKYVWRSKNCLEFSIAYQAEEGLKFLDDHFIQVQISKLI